MASRIWHPGIETEYVFDDWDHAQRELERRHGGLAAGMLASCVEIPLTDLAGRLDEAGVECRGREWNDTLLQTRQSGAHTLSLGGEMGTPDKRELRRVLRLSENKWARWYHTDAVGNASLLCWQEWDAP
jgi:hypothetical protein